MADESYVPEEKIGAPPPGYDDGYGYGAGYGYDDDDEDSAALRHQPRGIERFERLVHQGFAPDWVASRMLDEGYNFEIVQVVVRRALASSEPTDDNDEKHPRRRVPEVDEQALARQFDMARQQHERQLKQAEAQQKGLIELRQQVLALEKELLDAYDEFEGGGLKKELRSRDKAKLDRLQEQLNQALQPKREELAAAERALESAKAAGSGVEAAQQDVDRVNKELQTGKERALERYTKRKAELTAKTDAELARLRDNWKIRARSKRADWMKLMTALNGTHFPGIGVGRPPSQRHDGRPGAYGRTPSADDADNAQRDFHVFHGHGGWYRTGLVSQAMIERLPDMTTLSEVLRAANTKRLAKGLRLLRPEDVELAFVDHHGIPILMGAVMGGAYPNVKPVPPDIVAQLQELEKGCRSSKEFEERVKKLTHKANYKTEKSRKTGKTTSKLLGYSVVKPGLWACYERYRAGTHLQGKPGSYVDIIPGDSDAPFPNSLLGPLMGHDQGEREMSEYTPEDYHLHTVLSDSMDGVPKVWGGVSRRLSDVMVKVLSDAPDGGKPIRCVWAGCRSEQFPPAWDKNDAQANADFCVWVENAARARKRQRRHLAQQAIALPQQQQQVAAAAVDLAVASVPPAKPPAKKRLGRSNSFTRKSSLPGIDAQQSAQGHRRRRSFSG